MTDIRVPELGESIIDGTLTSWLVKENESFKSGDNLAEIETDKITIEIPAQADGVMKKIITQSGENVKVGQIIAEFENAYKKETPNINKEEVVPIKKNEEVKEILTTHKPCLLYTSPSPRDVEESRMPSSA